MGILSVAVLILEVQLERRLSKSGGVRGLVVMSRVGMVRSSCWEAGQFALTYCLGGQIAFGMGLAQMMIMTKQLRGRDLNGFYGIFGNWLRLCREK